MNGSNLKRKWQSSFFAKNIRFKDAEIFFANYLFLWEGKSLLCLLFITSCGAIEIKRQQKYSMVGNLPVDDSDIKTYLYLLVVAVISGSK